jgi:hypothetical protein
VERRSNAEGINEDGTDADDIAATLDSFDHSKLSVEGEKPLSIKQEDSFNPYDRKPGDRKKSEKPVKRDLRKLSEWIKKMREIEDRKSKGEDDE